MACFERTKWGITGAKIQIFLILLLGNFLFVTHDPYLPHDMVFFSDSPSLGNWSTAGTISVRGTSLGGNVRDFAKPTVLRTITK